MSDEKVIEVEGCDAVLKHWPFLLGSLAELNETIKDTPISTDSFLRVHLDIAVGKIYGKIFLLTSKNDKPLGFVSAFESTSVYGPGPVLWVYAIYSNDKKAGVPKILFSRLEEWAKDHGFVEIQTQSGRTSGASIRWCRAQFGLRLSKLFFSKTL